MVERKILEEIKKKVFNTLKSLKLKTGGRPCKISDLPFHFPSILEVTKKKDCSSQNKINHLMNLSISIKYNVAKFPTSIFTLYMP